MRKMGRTQLTSDLAWNAVSPFKAAMDMFVAVRIGLRMMYLQLRLVLMHHAMEMFHEVQRCGYYKMHTMFVQAHKRSTISMEYFKLRNCL